MSEDRYDWRAIQERWLPEWEKLDPFRAGQRGPDAERRYVLDMFPYPSGDLHMGHAEAFAWRRRRAALAPARLRRAAPDRLGLLRAARGERRDQAERPPGRVDVREHRDAGRRRSGATRSRFDWSRRLHTSDPEYYRWTQWLFLQLYERGLAYRKASQVNWCPKDQTVLANEQVVDGRLRALRHAGHQARADPVVLQDHRVRRAAAGRHGELEGRWPERVLTMQRNWIGRSEGAQVDFEIEGRDEPVTVFTTRPDTLYGATFFVVAADAAAGRGDVAPEQRAEFEAYLEQAQGRPRSSGCPPTGRRPVSSWAARDQPGERRADPGLGRRLRAGRLRHRRDHGRARARPARPGLRPGVRAAGPGRRATPASRTRP